MGKNKELLTNKRLWLYSLRIGRIMRNNRNDINYFGAYTYYRERVEGYTSAEVRIYRKHPG